MDSGVITFILLEGIGRACIDRSVTAQEMREALSYLLTEESGREASEIKEAPEKREASEKHPE